jgi:hypothetical protein
MADLLNIGDLRTDGNTQMREALNEEVIADYRYRYERGLRMPPLEVMYDGESYWVVDGFHRLEAASRVQELTKVECNVTDGSLDDARWMACGVNAAHGLRRTNADKRMAVREALQLPQADGMSARQVADHCGGVSHTLVLSIKRELEGGEDEDVVADEDEGVEGCPPEEQQPSTAAPRDPRASSAGVTTPREGKAARADAKMPEAPIDDEGLEVPRRLHEVFADRAAFTSIAREMDILLGRLRELADRPSGHYLDESDVCTDFQLVVNTVRDARPAFVTEDGDWLPVAGED